MLNDAWILLFAILITVGVFTGQGIVLALGVMGLLVGGISWLWNRFSLERVTYERTLSSHRIFTGEEVTLSVAISNRKPIPLGWLKAEDDIPQALELMDAKLQPTSRPQTLALTHSTSMAWYERVRWEYKLGCKERGFYRIGPARLRSGDLFGFFKSERQNPRQEHLLVYPKVVPLEELGFPPLRPLGDVKGGLAMFEDHTRPAGVRDYRPGDALKMVDWKATARRQSLQVQVFEPTVTHNLVVALNVDTTPHFWEGYVSMHLERAVTAAASIASDAFEKRHTVGLVSNGMALLAERPMTVPPSRGPDQLTFILEALATVGPVTSGSMEEVLLREAGKLPIGATLILVTAILPQELLDAVDHLARSRYKLVLVSVGDGEAPPPPEGVMLYEVGPYFASLESSGGKG